jgi:hypothetical protein
MYKFAHDRKTLYLFKLIDRVHRKKVSDWNKKMYWLTFDIL